MLTKIALSELSWSLAQLSSGSFRELAGWSVSSSGYVHVHFSTRNSDLLLLRARARLRVTGIHTAQKHCKSNIQHMWAIRGVM